MLDDRARRSSRSRASRRDRQEARGSRRRARPHRAGPAAAAPARPTREVPLPDVADGTLPNGLRVIAIAPAGRAAGRARGCGSRSAGRPTSHLRARGRAARPTTLLTGTATRDRVAIAAALQSSAARSRRPRRPRPAAGRPATGWPPGCPTLLGCSPTCSPAPPYPDAEVAARARPAGRPDRGRPRPAAHDRPGGAAAQAVYGDHPYAGRLPTADDVAAVGPRTRCAALHARRARAGGARSSCWSATSTPAAALDAVEKRARRLDRRGGPASAAGAAADRAAAAGARRPPGSVQSSLRLGRAGASAAPTPTTPRCSWPTSSSAATSPPAGWRTSARTRATPTAPHSGIELVAGRRGADPRRPTWPPRSPRRRCWRPATSWAAWPPCRRRAEELDAARRVRDRLAARSRLDSQGGLASTLSTLAAVGSPARLAPRATRAADGGHAWTRSPRRRGRSSRRRAVTGVIVGDADVIGPGLRALGGRLRVTFRLTRPPPHRRVCASRSPAGALALRGVPRRDPAPRPDPAGGGLVDGAAHRGRRRGPRPGRVDRRSDRRVRGRRCGQLGPRRQRPAAHPVHGGRHTDRRRGAARRKRGRGATGRCAASPTCSPGDDPTTGPTCA